MDPAELFRFVLALALTPVILSLGRRIATPGARVPFAVGYVALLVSFGLRLLQSTPLRNDVTRSIFHLAMAAGGAGFAWAAWELRKYVLLDAEVSR